MTGVDGINKFTNFLAAAQSQNQGDPYDLDLHATIEDVDPVNQFTFTEEGTTQLGCITQGFSACGCA